MNVGVFLYMIVVGLKQGVSMNMGHCIGAGNIKEAKEFMRVSN